MLMSIPGCAGKTFPSFGMNSRSFGAFPPVLFLEFIPTLLLFPSSLRAPSRPWKIQVLPFFSPPEFHFFPRRSARPGSGFLFPKSPFPSLPETQIKTKINKSRDPKFSGLSPNFPAPIGRTRPHLEFSSQKMKFHLPEAKITQIFPAGPNIWEGKRKFEGILESLEVGKTNPSYFSSSAQFRPKSIGSCGSSKKGPKREGFGIK